MAQGVTTNASQGGTCYSYASEENQWKAFERLPKTIRDALNNAAFSWAPYSIWRAWNQGRWKCASDAVRDIRRWDRETHIKDRKKDRYIIPVWK